MSKKKKQKKNKTQAVPQKKLLEKVTDSLYLVVDEDVTDIKAVIEATRREKWPCLLCFEPTISRGWSIPQTNAPGNYYLSAVYAVCDVHSEDTSANKELIIGNVQSIINNYRKKFDPDYQKELVEKQKQKAIEAQLVSTGFETRPAQAPITDVVEQNTFESPKETQQRKKGHPILKSSPIILCQKFYIIFL